jgi:tRNA dimethylallyltransferase
LIPEIDPPAARAPCEHGPLCFLIGTTASGKSELAPLLAERAGAEILSMDSMLSTAAWTSGRRSRARSCARARRTTCSIWWSPGRPSARSVTSSWRTPRCSTCIARGKRALFVGGTALYLKLLTHGLFEGPDVDPELRAELDRRWSSEGAAALQPGALPASTRRARRASMPMTGSASSARSRCGSRPGARSAMAARVAQRGRLAHRDCSGAWWGSKSPPRARSRIPIRTRELLDRGWLMEARAILDAGGFSATARQALGYTEVLAGRTAARSRRMRGRINLRTRQFARRQRTWFPPVPGAALDRGKTQDLAARADEVLREFEDAW